MAPPAIHIHDAYGHRFAFDGVTIFTLTEDGLIVGRRKAHGENRPYAVSFIEVFKARLRHAGESELALMSNALKERMRKK
jgi:hypothetical protein